MYLSTLPTVMKLHCSWRQRTDTLILLNCYLTVVEQMFTHMFASCECLQEINVEALNWTTPLHAASAAKSIPTAALLLAAGSKINAQKKDGFTALHIAAVKGDVEVRTQSLFSSFISLDAQVFVIKWCNRAN